MRSGLDVSAALYLSEALNFNIRWKIYSSAACKCVPIIFTFRSRVNSENGVGVVVDKATNSFNGLIGMVQRQVVRYTISELNHLNLNTSTHVEFGLENALRPH